MNRPIKFRAWVYDRSNDEYSMWYSDERGVGLGVFFEVMMPLRDEDELMRYTGLEDKNGTPIYEGDIIECDISMHLSSTLPHMGEVVYVDRLCSFATKNDSGETLFVKHVSGSREVIGNKFENPELLEQ